MPVYSPPFYCYIIRNIISFWSILTLKQINFLNIWFLFNWCDSFIVHEQWCTRLDLVLSDWEFLQVLVRVRSYTIWVRARVSESKIKLLFSLTFLKTKYIFYSRSSLFYLTSTESCIKINYIKCCDWYPLQSIKS
jgi:hypothetical protein